MSPPFLSTIPTDAGLASREPAIMERQTVSATDGESLATDPFPPLDVTRREVSSDSKRRPDSTSPSFVDQQVPTTVQHVLRERSTLRVLEPHLDSLAAEHADLVALDLSGGLSPRQAKRLAMVRWQLDRYDLARMEPTLDALERRAEEHARIADDVSELVKLLQDVHPRAMRGRGK